MKASLPRVLGCLSIVLVLEWGAALPFLWSQVSQDGQVEVLEPIEVTATRSAKPVHNIPNAVARIEKEDIQKGQPTLTLDESLSILPGLFFQNPYNFAQGLRISIRGFGARSPFGIRGIKILVDDIPQTLPDGISQMDAVDPGIIDHIEVLRGPSASLYGNASGGVISIFTENGPNDPFEIGSKVVTGSFGLLKTQLKLGGRTRTSDYRVFGSRLELNGYREHSVTEKLLFQTKFNWKSVSGSDTQLTVQKFYSPRAEDPGGLTGFQAAINPSQAHPQNVLFDAGEEVDQETLGWRWRKPLGQRQDLTFTAHLIHRDFSNRLPFVSGGQVEFERWAPGAALKYINNHSLFTKSNRWVAGIDVLYQNDDRQRFNNISGVRGMETLNQREIVGSLGIYVRDEMVISNDWELVAGGRYDWIHYRVNDAFLDDGDQSGAQTLTQGSGTLGVLYHLTQEHGVYLNGSTVFETPTTTELINNPSGGGGFSPNLKPQTSYSVELGLKGNPGIEYELALFYIRTEDEITPFELAAFPGRTFFRNAGTSERKGVEARLRWRPHKNWQGTVSYTYSDFEFKDFVVGGMNFKGNRLPGIPVHRAVGQIKYRHPQGWFGSILAEQVSRFYVNNENTAENPAYTITRLKLGMEKRWGSIRGSIFLGMNNLLDISYNANTRINAAGARYFEPAPPFNLFAGISLSWSPSFQ
ncbi:MAG: TonB-dependent receptor [Nitrospinaceae bacterium]|jgi:iron complex outermembrane receptor protein